MNANLKFDFSVNKENNTINVTREFDAQLQLVWNAYTQSEILDLWWAPKPWLARTKSMDFSNGGKWLYAMVGPNGEEHWALAKYEEIEDMKKFIAHDFFCDAEGKINQEMPESKWEVNFISRGEKTEVNILITYPNLAQLEDTIKMGFKEGLAMGMENLDALLADA